MTQEIGIIGAGLVGCLAALAFANKGYKVRVYEARPDLRLPEQQAMSQARSINLAVSARGITALKSVDLAMAERVLKDLVPMHGRMVHDVAGKQISQQYGLYGECINSINRALLNRSLLDELDRLDNVEVVFGYKLVKCEDLTKPDRKPRGFFSVESSPDLVEVKSVDAWIGADGSYSRLRTQIQRAIPMNFSQEYIDHYYLELRIPAGQAPDKFLLDPNHLHIWPRHEYMLIALANSDGSFTCTLFAPKNLFDNHLTTDKAILELFSSQFGDALDLMGESILLESFHNNPKGSLVCVRCSPYNVGGSAIIIGDAAHSMVPFYGQGMNCGFEDVRVLMEVLEEHNFDFASAFSQYSAKRRADLGAIVDLSMRNYVEMRHDVTSASYLVRKKLDGVLSRVLGDIWLPLYTMVSFRADIPYSRAVAERQRQNNILTWALRATTGSVVAAIVAFAPWRSLYGRFSRQ